MVGNPHHPGELLEGRVAVVDLMDFATPTEVLRLAGRALVGGGADRATSYLATRNPSPRLSLVSHEQFGSDYAEYFAVRHDGDPLCAAAADLGVPVMVEDLAADTGFGDTEAGRVILRAGSRACLSYPLLDEEGRLLGTISAHWSQPGPRPADPIRVVAEEATRLLAPTWTERGGEVADPVLEAEHLRRALATRTVIGQAQGILMAREGIDAQAAFDVLRHASQRTNRKLHDVALDMVSGAGTRRP